MKRLPILCVLVVCSLSVTAAPQPANTTRTGTSSVPKNGFRSEFLANLQEVEDKLMELATSIPAEKYSWRPDSGVRSIGEVFMHIAGANYFLATFLGRQPPVDIPKDMERISDKQKVLVELRRSFDHVRSIAVNARD